MDCAEEEKDSKRKENVIKFGKTDEEYEEKVATGGDGPSKRSSEKKLKKEKGQISVMKKAPAKKAVKKRKSSEKEEEQREGRRAGREESKRGGKWGT